MNKIPGVLFMIAGLFFLLEKNYSMWALFISIGMMYIGLARDEEE